MDSGYGNYVWKRLLTVSAEDVCGLITSEIKALHDSYVFVNKTVSAKQPKGRIFISKAVILLCAARKSRDADHLQNFVYDALAGIDADKLAAELLKAGKEKVPDYAFDCHTLQGEAKGQDEGGIFPRGATALKPFSRVCSTTCPNAESARLNASARWPSAGGRSAFWNQKAVRESKKISNPSTPGGEIEGKIA